MFLSAPEARAGQGAGLQYQLVIFDFDGTLADTFPFFLEAYSVVAAAHGLRRLDHRQLDTLRGLSSRQLMAHVGLPLWKLPRVAQHFHTLMGERIEQIALFDGMHVLLRQLAAQGVQLAIVSSNSLANVRRVLGPDSAALFTRIECGVALFGKRSKLRRLVRASGVPRARVLCVGDELRDADAALAEGLAFGAVTWGYSSAAALRARAPTLLLRDVAELAQALAPAV